MQDKCRGHMTVNRPKAFNLQLSTTLPKEWTPARIWQLDNGTMNNSRNKIAANSELAAIYKMFVDAKPFLILPSQN